MEAYLSKNITSNTTTTVCETAGVLHFITVNKTAAGTIIAYDGDGGSVKTIATLKASVVEDTYVYHAEFSDRLIIVTAASPDITISYSISGS